MKKSNKLTHHNWKENVGQNIYRIINRVTNSHGSTRTNILSLWDKDMQKLMILYNSIATPINLNLLISSSFLLFFSISLASVCSVTSGYLAKWPKYPFLLDLVNRNFSVWWGMFWSRELLEGKYLGGGCSHFQDVVCIIVSIVYCLNFEGPALVVWAF